MSVRIEKKDRVWTVIHSRPEARNAMDPASAEALVESWIRDGLLSPHNIQTASKGEKP